MDKFKRIFLVVLDSVGIGEAPDAAEFNDVGADTLGHIAAHRNGIHLPHLEKMGLGHIHQVQGVEADKNPIAHYGRMQEASNGKDTMTGHWEIMGLHIEEPFQTFPNGFPEELIEKIEEITGRKVIGNKPASGTAIIEELGKEHMETGAIIVYTSADPVLQIAAHESVISLDELYTICKEVRAMTNHPPYKVGRIIARPFDGELGNFERRNEHRHDYALSPFERTAMNELKDNGNDVIALGKIHDIYNGEGITETEHTNDNEDGVNKLLNVLERDFNGLTFLNLVDFDSKFGHRRDPDGYGEALEAFDNRLPEILEKLREGDLLLITADHGNDPTFKGTDHTRELVPLFAYHKQIKVAENLGLRSTFADIAATISDNFNVTMPKHGISFKEKLI